MTGLEDVIAFDTELSHIDGEAGRLLVRGHDIGQFAALGYERACGLLWADDPSPTRAREISRALGKARAWTFAKAPAWKFAMHRDAPMASIRTALSALDIRGNDRAAAATIVGAISVLLAAWRRTADDKPWLAPDPAAPHAADLMRMLTGTQDGPRARALDAYLCTVMEHGMNASTFAARVVASTDADTVGAVIAGMCALEGRLHGGAPGPVLDMLDAVGKAEHAHSWIQAELGAGRRIMGMGHRVYRARDPRAAVLEGASRSVNADSARVALARAVEAAAESQLASRHPGRPLRANVEFFTAVLLEAIGIPRAMFTATFAAGRVVGWCAHVDEQRRTGRLIRPRARYIGRAS